MPSVSTKIEITASSEALEPIRKVLNVVDKKVRNLEKRKGKLDVYKEKQDSGDKLEKDQQVAVARYGEVIQNLEFARDLQKQFQAINNDAEKLLKKQAKRGKSEKQLQEVKKVKEVLQLQGLLDSLGSENVRKDFQSGKHGAIVLTEENLDQLDELYKLISPSRDGETDYHQSLSQAAEHIVSLLDARNKEVVGTTYKELKELLDLISECGYFEKAPYQDSESKDQVAEGEFEVIEAHDVPNPDSEEVQSALPPEIPNEPEPASLGGGVSQGGQVIDTTVTSFDSEQQVPQIAAEADSFFSANSINMNTQATQQQQQQPQQAVTAGAFDQKRPFQEIVSSVQGSFNFLQESTIEMEAKREFSPHMDPAVVAAHPMPQPQSMVHPPPTQTPDTTPGLSQSGYGASSYTEQPQPLDTETSHGATHSATVDQSLLSQQQQQTATVQSQDFTNSGFSQSSLSHSLPTDNLFSSGAVSGTDSTNMTNISDVSDAISSHFEIPPKLPMPPGHDQSQDSQQYPSDKKGMNPHASEFQSQFYTAETEQEPTDKSSNDTSQFQGGTYSNSNYQQSRDHRGNRDNSSRGGYRNDRGRGGYNRGGMGGNNTSNGYSRGGRSDRGSYQGYPPRDNYRQEGYQGYGGNSYNSGGFNKRGGGPPRGGNRGGRGGSGYNRGGPRGGRGGNQGFGRPNFNQQQTAQ